MLDIAETSRRFLIGNAWEEVVPAHDILPDFCVLVGRRFLRKIEESRGGLFCEGW